MAKSSSKKSKKPAPQKKPAANASKRQPKQSRHQVAAILLFAVAILAVFLLAIPGQRVWLWLGDLLRGTFGLCAVALPVLLVYIAVMAAKETPKGEWARKVWLSGLVLLVLSTTVHVFAADAELAPYKESLNMAFEGGKALSGGGVFGALLGHPFEYFFTDIGAKIILCLVLFVSVMLMTGTGILKLFHTLWKPVEKTKNSLHQAIEEAEEEEPEEEKKPKKESKEPASTCAIDIDMGDGYPAEEPPKKADRKTKLENLKKAAENNQTRERFAYDMPLDGEEFPIVLAKEPKEEVAAEPSIGEDAVLVEPEEEVAPVKEEKAAPLNDIEKVAINSSLDKAMEETAANTYRYPPLSLLDEAKPANLRRSEEEQQQIGALLVNTLQEFGVSTKMLDVSRGPSVTRYELQPSAGVKISKITSLSDDIALRLATTGVRIEAPIPNKAAVGIEVPNKVAQSVGLRELLDTPAFSAAKSNLTVALGRDIAGKPVFADLSKMPHLLIAGTTGSGKSVCTNSMIQSILYKSSPEEVRMLLIDPKQVEFGIYNGIPHLLVPVVTDPRKAAGALGWAVTEMLKRYQMFAENNVRDISSYNEMARKTDNIRPLPLILIVIDELADLMMSAANEVEDAIVRLAQMARAAGMHLVIATQRPSVDVITGLIKANIPSRLALTVASAVDSRTILDGGGAEKLLGKGDMLFAPVGMSKPMRIQGCFVSNKEVERVVDFLKDTQNGHDYDQQIIDEINRQAEAAAKSSRVGGDVEEDEMEDDMLPEAIQVAVEAGSISTSMLQRKLRLGYARAGRIMDMMEQKGVVGPPMGSKPREVLITRQQWLEMSLNRADSAPVEDEIF